MFYIYHFVCHGWRGGDCLTGDITFPFSCYSRTYTCPWQSLTKRCLLLVQYIHEASLWTADCLLRFQQHCLSRLVIFTLMSLSHHFNLILLLLCLLCRPHCLRGLRRSSKAVRLHESWFRIPLGAWMFVCCECYVCVCVCCQVEVSVTSWPLVQGIPTDWGASLCVNSKPHEWGVRAKQAETLVDACSNRQHSNLGHNKISS